MAGQSAGLKGQAISEVVSPLIPPVIITLSGAESRLAHLGIQAASSSHQHALPSPPMDPQTARVL